MTGDPRPDPDDGQSAAPADSEMTTLFEVVSGSSASYLSINTKRFRIRVGRAAEQRSGPAVEMPIPSPNQAGMVISPAVGTVSLLAGQGDDVRCGQRIAAVRMHDRDVDVHATTGGSVLELAVGPDDFVEFGQPLMRIGNR